MKYFVPATLSEAQDLLKKWKGKARIVAGCTNIIPALRAKVLDPKALINVTHLKGLSFIKEGKKEISIGGLTAIQELTSSKIIQKYGVILSEAACQFGNPLIRNRATIGGNLADGSPAADTAVPLLTLDSIVVTDKRKVPIDRFFTGPNRTVLKTDEIIKEITFFKPGSHTRMGYLKLGLRNAMAISVVSLAIVVEMEGTRCRKARIGLGAVAPTPLRAYRTERMLVDVKVTGDLIEACGEEIKEEISPITDIRASAEYRRSMTSVLFRRLIQQVSEIAGHEDSAKSYPAERGN